MARSLMELYGGGMTGPPTDYQLGGRIASARRGRAQQQEKRHLKTLAEEAQRRQQKSGMWGGIGSLVGGTLGSFLGPWGTAVGAGLGRSLGERGGGGMREVDVSGGKYFKEGRQDIEEAQRDYRRGGTERALVSGVMAGVMPEVYGAAGKWLKGLGGAKEAAQASAIEAGTGLYGVSPPPALDTMFGVPTQGAMGSLEAPTLASKFGITPKFGEGYQGLKLTSPIPPSNLSGTFAPLGAMPTTAASAAVPAAVSTVASAVVPEAVSTLASTGGAGSIGEIAQDFMSYAPDESFFDPSFSTGYDPLSGMPIRKGGGLIDYTIPQMQGGGYATATDPVGALQQMGMGDIAADERLQEYLTDLPQFGQGYEQQIGDIRTGAQTGLFGLTQQAGAAPAATSFAGAGAPQTAMQRQREQMMTKYGQQKRGVVEGYQADLLSAIRDIEEKGEFEFGVGAGTKGQGTVSGWPSQEAYDNWVAAGADINALTAYGWSGTGADDPHSQYGQQNQQTGLQQYQSKGG